jgi:hypothetical protein
VPARTITWMGLVRPFGFFKMACTAVCVRAMLAKGPSVLLELGAARVPLHVSCVRSAQRLADAHAMQSLHACHASPGACPPAPSGSLTP